METHQDWNGHGIFCLSNRNWKKSQEGSKEILGVCPKEKKLLKNSQYNDNWSENWSDEIVKGFVDFLRSIYEE